MAADAELEVLARRAVACKGWRWMAGMLTMDGDRVVNVTGRRTLRSLMGRPLGAQPVLIDRADADGGNCELPGDALPDLTDPATLGCLLALVREAWGEFGQEAFSREIVGGTVRVPCWVVATRSRARRRPGVRPMTPDRCICPSCRRVYCVCPEPLSATVGVLAGVAVLSYVMLCALAALAAGGWLS